MSLLCTTNEAWTGVVSSLENLVHHLGAGVVSLSSRQKNMVKWTHSIMLNPPAVIIIGGYGNEYTTLINGLTGKSKIIVKWCSSTLQMEVSDEIPHFNHILGMLKAGKIYSIAFSSLETYTAMKQAFPNLRFAYFPEAPVFRDVNKLVPLDSSRFHVDLFCTPNPRKNIWNQMLAFEGMAQTHVNFSLPSYVEMAKQFPSVVNHGRLSRETLDALSASMDLCAQVTVAETYNYVAADHMFWGVPVISSHNVPAVCETTDKTIRKYLIVDKLDDPSAIRNAANYIRKNPSLHTELRERVHRHILEQSQQRKDILLESFDRLVNS